MYWKDYEEVFTWIRGNSFEDDIIASNFDPLVYLYTGRKSIMPYELEPTRWLYGDGKNPFGSDEELLKYLSHLNADYLAIFPMPDLLNADILPSTFERLRASYPTQFELMYRGTDTRFLVYRLKKE